MTRPLPDGDNVRIMATYPQSRWLKGILWVACLGCVALVGVFAAAVVYYKIVAGEVEAAFANYRWQVPSRIYSDRQPIFAGQDLERQGVFKRLERTGYRRVDHRPRQPGEFRHDRSLLEIYQRHVVHPTLGHPSRRLFLTLSGDRIVRIETEEKGDAPLVFLEPELLGVLIGDTWQDRELVTLEEMPSALTQAVVAIEDRRFFQHRGVDPRGIARALVTDIRERRLAQGGSTLSQQLVKNIILQDPRKKFSRKAKEIVMAYAIDREYSKEEILLKYLNEIYFGQNGPYEVRGIGSAARFYFAKPVDELSLAEAAALAGVVHGPNRYLRDGVVSSEPLTHRRNQVLDAMYEVGFITERELEDAKIEPSVGRSSRPPRRLAPYFIDLVQRNLRQDYSLDGLRQEGLSIHTTLQLHIQEAAEQAVRTGLATLEQRHPRLRRNDPAGQLQAAAVVLRPATGEILALVGGRDYQTTQYDRIHQAMRQPGSLIKAFTYLAALEEAHNPAVFPGEPFSPVYPLADTETTFVYRGVDYTPRNYDKLTRGEMPAYQALASSLNIPAVALYSKVGPHRVEQTYRRFGFTSPLADYLPSALGASEVYPIEMARAYGAIAAGGSLAQPRMLTNVMNRHGEVLRHKALRFAPAATSASVAVLNDMLSHSIERGTARAIRAAGITEPLAGKTGSTSDGKDAWFVGYSPDFLALVWVGFDDATPMGLTGSGAALPIWIELVRALELSGEPFPRSEGVDRRRIDVAGMGLATARCPSQDQIQMAFLKTPGIPDCRLHAPESMANPITPMTIQSVLEAAQ